MAPLRLVLVVVVGCALHFASACTQTVHVRSPMSGTLTLEGTEEAHEVKRGDNVIDVPRGMGNIPFRIEGESQAGAPLVVEGEIPRDDPQGLIAVTAALGALCAVPTCMWIGCCAANPQLAALPLLLGLTLGIGNVGLAFSTCYGVSAQLCLTPGYLTLPACSAGLGAGLTPLGLLTFAWGVSDDVVIEQLVTAPKLPSGEMAW